MTVDDLVASDNVFFAATGVTGGEFLDAVNFTGENRAETHSVIMRSKTGSIRYMFATHDLRRLRAISSLTLD
jgi:fructose-1,6-bisphosphatase II